MIDIDVRIDKGMALLDSSSTGWRDELDYEKLDLSSVSQCILGQLYRKAYPDAELFWCTEEFYEFFGLEDHADAVRHGFDIAPGERAAELDDAWKVKLLNG